MLYSNFVAYLGHCVYRSGRPQVSFNYTNAFYVLYTDSELAAPSVGAFFPQHHSFDREEDYRPMCGGNEPKKVANISETSATDTLVSSRHSSLLSTQIDYESSRNVSEQTSSQASGIQSLFKTKDERWPRVAIWTTDNESFSLDASFETGPDTHHRPQLLNTIMTITSSQLAVGTVVQQHDMKRYVALPHIGLHNPNKQMLNLDVSVGNDNQLTQQSVSQKTISNELTPNCHLQLLGKRGYQKQAKLCITDEQLVNHYASRETEKQLSDGSSQFFAHKLAKLHRQRLAFRLTSF